MYRALVSVLTQHAGPVCALSSRLVRNSFGLWKKLCFLSLCYVATLETMDVQIALTVSAKADRTEWAFFSCSAVMPAPVLRGGQKLQPFPSRGGRSPVRAANGGCASGLCTGVEEQFIKPGRKRDLSAPSRLLFRAPDS